MQLPIPPGIWMFLILKRFALVKSWRPEVRSY